MKGFPPCFSGSGREPYPKTLVLTAVAGFLEGAVEGAVAALGDLGLAVWVEVLLVWLFEVFFFGVWALAMQPKEINNTLANNNLNFISFVFSIYNYIWQKSIKNQYEFHMNRYFFQHFAITVPLSVNEISVW
ncbi:MAG: hypothetical protein J5792_08465 [Bacteroidales bacterium]|nr:hypothetical protein [Bacteroidales bacterium]